MTKIEISFKIKPINSIEEGIKLGNYNSIHDFITDKNISLKNLTEEKEVFLVSFNNRIGETEYKDFLRKEGLKPCIPNYLLGLMSQVKEDDMPKELKNRDIVVPYSVSTDKYGYNYFLYVGRIGRYRRLHLAYVDGSWDENWVFLSEKEEDYHIPSTPVQMSTFNKILNKILH